MKRRGFLAALAALPFIGRRAKAAPSLAAMVVDVGGTYEACAYERGMLMDRGGKLYWDAPEPWRPAFVVTAVDYEKGTITISSLPAP
jgi:hypothetical protein